MNLFRLIVDFWLPFQKLSSHKQKKIRIINAQNYKTCFTSFLVARSFACHTTCCLRLSFNIKFWGGQICYLQNKDYQNLGLFEIVFWFPEDVSNYGGIFAKFPVFFAWMAGFSEAVGGFLFMLGFQTRISALLILTTMMGAIFLQQIQQGMWNTLPALGFLWVSIYSLTIGSGRFGLDYLLFKKFDR